MVRAFVEYTPQRSTLRKNSERFFWKVLDADDSVRSELSASTLQRMVKDYLKRRNYNSICFTQSDHNACPNCKTLHYAVLQYHHEAMLIQREYEELSQRPRPYLESDQKRMDNLSHSINAKQFQE